jgi:glyoxylase-like metal-dependent hydrolase (beta-lactamase superfamily II)
MTNPTPGLNLGTPVLPGGITVLERGWLSSNNILIQGAANTALIDSGYGSHAAQTLALVKATLQDRPLDVLLNTHLHSDHCGGNAALQAAFPQLQTLIPAGQAHCVREWDVNALGFAPTGQICPRFAFDGVLQPGTDLQLGDGLWQVHAAPGHDPHSVILFEPVSRLLVSADALWQRGFGVVFPELDGKDAFDEVADTLDLIASLRPAMVIPGHGQPFTDIESALAIARQRLNGFVANPQRHLQHAAKVLLKFKLLDAQCLTQDELMLWAKSTPYLQRMVEQLFADLPFEQSLHKLVQDLVQAGVASWNGDLLQNA